MSVRSEEIIHCLVELLRGEPVGNRYKLITEVLTRGAFERVKIYPDIADIAPVLARLGNQHRPALGIVDQIWCLLRMTWIYRGMTVAADDDVDVAARPGQVHVGGLAVDPRIADMRHSHHEVAMLLILQIFSRGVGCLDYILESDGYACRGYETRRINVESDEPYLFPSYFLYNVWVEDTLELCAGEVVVGGETGTLHLPVMAGKLLHAVVKLMVAEDTDVVAHHVHKRIFHIPLEILEKKCALHHVAGVDEYHVLLGFPHGIDYGLTLQYAPLPVGVRLYIRMGVVGVEYHQRLGRRTRPPAKEKRGGGRCYEISIPHHMKLVVTVTPR